MMGPLSDGLYSQTTVLMLVALVIFSITNGIQCHLLVQMTCQIKNGRSVEQAKKTRKMKKRKIV